MDRTLLTTTGCYGTGSSAITDLIREFECVDCKGDYEVRFVHDPGGISDLEYNIIENPNRHNSSNSIKCFLAMMKDLDHIWFIQRYRKQFGENLLKYTDKYIKAITICNYQGLWHYDVYNRGKLFYIMSRTFANVSILLNKKCHLPLFGGYDLIPKEEQAYLPIIDEQHFLRSTQEFIDEFISSIFPLNRKYIFLDQLVPPSNFERYIRYFKKIRIVLVERDPRDIYIMEKYIWKGRVAPVYDVQKFCEWYKWTRELYQKRELPDCVIKIQFEDLVYYYDKTIRKIKRHYDLENAVHSKPLKYFNPKISVVNTQTWKRFPNEKENIEVIEKKLNEFCYFFPEDIKLGKGKEKMF